MQIAPFHSRSAHRIRPDGRALPPGRMIALGALSALLLSGCAAGSSGGSPSISTEGVAGSVSPARNGAELNPAPADKSAAGQVPGQVPGSADSAKPGAPMVTVGPKLTKSASLDLQVTDINVAAAQVRSIAAGLQALVINEQIGKAGPRNPRAPQPLQDGDQAVGGFGTLTLSVPADKLDAALDQLGSSKVGTVLARNTSSQDVTSQYVDTESRLKTMRASVARVRALMAQAKDIGQVVALESEMSQREADLESLASQLEALKTGVERSTLAVSLSTPAPGAEAVAAAADNGFLAGLRSGWSAFTTAAQGLFTGVGAVLPFAAFFALVSAPIVIWWRRRQTNRPVTAPVGPTSAAPAPAA